MPDLINTEAPHYCKIKVWHGEDWYDALPQLVDPVSGNPVDLTDVVIELYIRPSFNHATRFVLLSSALSSVGDGGIIKEDAANGLIAIFYPQADVEAELPISNNNGWRQFMRFIFTDPDLGVVTKLIWTGPILVLPARDTATS